MDEKPRIPRTEIQNSNRTIRKPTSPHAMTVAEPPSKPGIQEEDTTLATMAVAEPPKKPQSAYFIFSSEQRQAIKEELLKTKDKVSMGEVAKAISVKWKALTDEEKGAYQTQAAAQKEASWQSAQR